VVDRQKEFEGYEPPLSAEAIALKNKTKITAELNIKERRQRIERKSRGAGIRNGWPEF